MDYENVKFPDIIIFDFDGTLTKPSILSRFVAATNTDNLVRAGLKITHNLYRAFRGAVKTMAPEISLDPAIKRKVLTHFAKPQEGLSEITDYLRRHDVKIAIASQNTGDPWIHRLMRHLDFGGKYDVILHSDNLPRNKGKPDPEAVRRVIESLGGSIASEADKTGAKTPSALSVWIVGDSSQDMRMAVNAASNKSWRAEADITAVALGAKSSAASFLNKHFKSPAVKLTGYVADTYPDLRILLDKAQPKAEVNIPSKSFIT